MSQKLQNLAYIYIVLQGEMHRCCAKCCDNKTAETIDVKKCVLKCQANAEKTREVLLEVIKV
jgi:hypothetical protein